MITYYNKTKKKGKKGKQHETKKNFHIFLFIQSIQCSRALLDFLVAQALLFGSSAFPVTSNQTLFQLISSLVFMLFAYAFIFFFILFSLFCTSFCIKCCIFFFCLLKQNIKSKK